MNAAPLRVLIVDDELPARERLQSLVNEPTWVIGHLVDGEPGHRRVRLVG